MELIIEFLKALVDLSNAMAPFILFGLLLAGILHELVPSSIVTKHLGKANIISVIKSTLFGVPLPVCSCGVIPLATSIKKSGASKGATLSFLISTPITGVDSILATYGIFGWIFTIYRIVTSMIIAMISGILTNIFDNHEEEESKAQFTIAKPAKPVSALGVSFAPKEKESCCESDESSCCSSSNSSCCGSEESSCCESESSSCCSSETSYCDSQEKPSSFSLSRALQYAFVTLLGDIAKPLLWGLLFGALITVAIPQNLSDILIEYSWLSYIIVIAIAVPMYVCATASLPIAAGLMLSGVSAGAAFVFLTAGPATNTVTIGVVKKMLGSRALSIYLGSIIIGSMLFGLGLDYLFSSTQIDPKSLVHIEEEGGVVAIASSILLWGMVGRFLIRGILNR